MSECECDMGCMERCGERLYLIERYGRRIKVCGNCILPNDIEIKETGK